MTLIYDTNAFKTKFINEQTTITITPVLDSCWANSDTALIVSKIWGGDLSQQEKITCLKQLMRDAPGVVGIWAGSDTGDFRGRYPFRQENMQPQDHKSRTVVNSSSYLWHNEPPKQDKAIKKRGGATKYDYYTNQHKYGYFKATQINGSHGEYTGKDDVDVAIDHHKSFFEKTDNKEDNSLLIIMASQTTRAGVDQNIADYKVWLANYIPLASAMFLYSTSGPVVTTSYDTTLVGQTIQLIATLEIQSAPETKIVFFWNQMLVAMNNKFCQHGICMKKWNKEMHALNGNTTSYTITTGTILASSLVDFLTYDVVSVAPFAQYIRKLKVIVYYTFVGNTVPASNVLWNVGIWMDKTQLNIPPVSGQFPDTGAALVSSLIGPVQVFTMEPGSLVNTYANPGGYYEHTFEVGAGDLFAQELDTDPAIHYHLQGTGGLLSPNLLYIAIRWVFTIDQSITTSPGTSLGIRINNIDDSILPLPVTTGISNTEIDSFIDNLLLRDVDELAKQYRKMGFKDLKPEFPHSERTIMSILVHKGHEHFKALAWNKLMHSQNGNQSNKVVVTQNPGSILDVGLPQKLFESLLDTKIECWEFDENFWSDAADKTGLAKTLGRMEMVELWIQKAEDSTIPIYKAILKTIMFADIYSSAVPGFIKDVNVADVEVAIVESKITNQSDHIKILKNRRNNKLEQGLQAATEFKTMEGFSNIEVVEEIKPKLTLREIAEQKKNAILRSKSAIIQGKVIPIEQIKVQDKEVKKSEDILTRVEEVIIGDEKVMVEKKTETFFHNYFEELISEMTEESLFSRTAKNINSAIDYACTELNMSRDEICNTFRPYERLNGHSIKLANKTTRSKKKHRKEEKMDDMVKEMAESMPQYESEMSEVKKEVMKLNTGEDGISRNRTEVKPSGLKPQTKYEEKQQHDELEKAKKEKPFVTGNLNGNNKKNRLIKSMDKDVESFKSRCVNIWSILNDEAGILEDPDDVVELEMITTTLEEHEKMVNSGKKNLSGTSTTNTEKREIKKNGSGTSEVISSKAKAQDDGKPDITKLEKFVIRRKHMLMNMDGFVGWGIMNEPSPEVMGRMMRMAGLKNHSLHNKEKILFALHLITNGLKVDPEIRAWNYILKTETEEVQKKLAVQFGMDLEKITLISGYEKAKAELWNRFMHGLNGNIVNVFVLLFVSLVMGQAVCGNYCGPTWCAGNPISERLCVSSGIWGNVIQPTCADLCCAQHDYCCGADLDRSVCNRGLVDCLYKSGCYTSPCGALVITAMYAVNNWCCGVKCPQNFSYDKVLADSHNKTMHALNGNMMSETVKDREEKNEKQNDTTNPLSEKIKDAECSYMDIPKDVVSAPPSGGGKIAYRDAAEDWSKLQGVQLNSGNLQNTIETVSGSISLKREQPSRIIIDENTKLVPRETFGSMRVFDETVNSAFRLKVLNIKGITIAKNTRTYTQNDEYLKTLEIRMRLRADVTTENAFYAADVLQIGTWKSDRADVFEYNFLKLWLYVLDIMPNMSTLKTVPLHGTLQHMDSRLRPDYGGDLFNLAYNLSPVFNEDCALAGVRFFPFEAGVYSPRIAFHVMLSSIPATEYPNVIAMPTWVMTAGIELMNTWLRLIVLSFMPYPAGLFNWFITCIGGPLPLVIPYANCVRLTGIRSGTIHVLLPLSGQNVSRPTNQAVANSLPISRPAQDATGALVDVNWDPTALVTYPLLEFCDVFVNETLAPLEIVSLLNLLAKQTGQADAVVTARHKARLFAWRGVPLTITPFNGAVDTVPLPMVNTPFVEQECDFSGASIARLAAVLPTEPQVIDYVLYDASPIVWNSMVCGVVSPKFMTIGNNDLTYHEMAYAQMEFRRCLSSVQILHDLYQSNINDWQNPEKTRNSAWAGIFNKMFSSVADKMIIIAGSMGNVVADIMGKYLKTGFVKDRFGYNMLHYRTRSLFWQVMYNNLPDAPPINILSFKFGVYQDIWMSYLIGDSQVIQYCQPPAPTNLGVKFVMTENLDLQTAGTQINDTAFMFPVKTGSESSLANNSYIRPYIYDEEHNRRALLWLSNDAYITGTTQWGFARVFKPFGVAEPAYGAGLTYYVGGAALSDPNLNYVSISSVWANRLDFIPKVDWTNLRYLFIGVDLAEVATVFTDFCQSSINLHPYFINRILYTSSASTPINVIKGLKHEAPFMKNLETQEPTGIESDTLPSNSIIPVTGVNTGLSK